MLPCPWRCADMTEMETRDVGCLDTVVGSRPLVGVLVAGVGVDKVAKKMQEVERQATDGE